MQAGRDWTSDVRDISKHPRADTASDLSDTLKVDNARIRRRATDKQFRPVLFGYPLQIVIVDLFCLARNTVISNFVTQTRKVQRMTVRQMTAVRQVHSQYLITILDRGKINRHVRLRAAVRLHVRMIGAKQLLRAIDRGLLDDVGPLTPAVITFARITFSVLVGEHRSRGFEHGLTNKVLGGDELKPVSLAGYFVVDGAGNHRIDFGK